MVFGVFGLTGKGARDHDAFNPVTSGDASMMKLWEKYVQALGIALWLCLQEDGP